MNFELTDEQAAALLKELTAAVACERNYSPAVSRL
jgi:hypothetical protein